MDAIKQMRSDVKKYIETADAKVVKMVHAMLEIEQEGDWWQDEATLSIIEKRTTAYKSGKVKGIPWEEAKRQLLARSKRKSK